MRTGWQTLLLALCLAGTTSGQTVADNAAKWERYQDSVTNSKLGKPFLPEPLVLSTADNRKLDFAALPHKTFIYAGMSGCTPCKRELPVIIALAAKNPEVDFIYLTHDDAATRKEEFDALLGKNYTLPPNFATLQLSVEEMKRLHIYLGYPAKYFLDQQGIVRYFRWGGESMKKTKEEVEQIYSDVIHAQ